MDQRNALKARRDVGVSQDERNGATLCGQVRSERGTHTHTGHQTGSENSAAFCEAV